MSVQSFIRKDVSGMLHHIDDCLEQAQKNCSTSYTMIRDWMDACLKDHTIHAFSIQPLSQPVMLPPEMNHLPDHRIPYPLSELSSSQTKEPNDSASVRGVSSKHYGTIKSTPIASRMYSKPYTMDTKPPPLTPTPRPPKSRLIDSAKKPSPEDPAADRRAAAYQKYRGRLIDALVKDCRNRDLPSTGTKSDLIFRLVEDDLSRAAAKAKPPLVAKPLGSQGSPGSPFSVPSRLNTSSAAVSPGANFPRSLLTPVKPFTHTTEQTSQLAAEPKFTFSGEKGQQREVPEKRGFSADVKRTIETNVVESPINPSGTREMKRPPAISLQLHTEGARDIRTKSPIDADGHVAKLDKVKPIEENRYQEAEPPNDDDMELWFESPLLERYLQKQSSVNPDWIFAPIMSCNLSDIFPDGAHSSEGRGSSGNWDDEGSGHVLGGYSMVNRSDR